MKNKIPFIWSNDDITTGQRASMERQLAFLERFGLKGTFFVVPCPLHEPELTEDAPLLELLKQAMAAGHDVQQHSTTHQCAENGTADLRMFQLMGDTAMREHSDNRFVYERLWQVDAIEAQIGWGRDVWTQAFGAPSEGFRAGCGSFCGNLYPALENLGFQWCSSRLVSLTGWMRQAGHDQYPLRLEGPLRPYRQGKLLEIPILDDVAFRVPRARVDDYVELGRRLWESCVERQIPAVLLSHPHGLEWENEGENGTGYAVHEKLLPLILESGLAKPMTISEYHRRIEAGEYPLAAPTDLYPNPDQIPDWHIWSRRGSAPMR